MEGAKAGPQSGGGRSLIERPRLTRLLDEAQSRVILLVAPAGYGKTTLARQWVARMGEPVVWYDARPASTDVAGLALGLRTAFARRADKITDRVSERLRTSTDPDREASDLAGVLAGDISTCPDETFLVIDDYHCIAAGSAAESFIAAFVDMTAISLLISTRVRPSWITARHLLYGEVLELGRNVLAMTHEEAEAVLGPGTAERRLSGLVALAEGWPAVIGLAALLPEPGELVIQAVPQALHDYFAEELYQGMSDGLKWKLVQLSVVPSLDAGLSTALAGNTRILEEGYRRGFLTREDSSYAIHPLLRQFLRRKAEDFPESDLSVTAARATHWYLDHSLWDEAFTLASEFELADVLVDLIERGLDSVLSEGRMSTLDSWLEVAKGLRATDPVVRLGEIESAFRRGRWREAESKAVRLAQDLPVDHRFGSRVLFRAGQIAQLDDRQDAALELLTRAQERAQSDSDIRRTMWSKFVTLCDLEEPAQAWQTLVELEQRPPSTVEDLVRIRHARLVWALRWGGIPAELALQEDSLELITNVPDPLVRTGFLQSLGSALGLATRYSEALEIAERQQDEARESGLEWVEPHALELKGLAELGLRDFKSAVSSLNRAHSLATNLGNLHSQMSSVSLTARVYLARGELERAVTLLGTDWERRASSGMLGDYLATRALVCACSGQVREAIRFADESKAVSDQIDGRVLRMFAEAVVSGHQGKTAETLELVADAVREARTTGNLDAFVCAYRGNHSLLSCLQALDHEEEQFVQRLVGEVDPQLADKAGFEIVASDSLITPIESLTPREQEVFDLMRQGLTNRQIARSMWIEESTVKVHVRHILRKLGARTRTEAVTRAAEAINQPQPAGRAE